MDKNQEQTIVIKRGKKAKGGAHGGSWKIAFADFALAMMAFFLVLWLMETSTDLEKMAIAGYFSDPRSLTEEGDGGTPYVLDLGGRPLNIANPELNLALVREDQEQVVEAPQELENPEYMEVARLRQKEALDEVREELEERLEGYEEFEWFNDSVLMEVTDQGLSIQIIDREGRPMFAAGSDELRPYAMEMLWLIAQVLESVPNMLSIYGHTDAQPFGSSPGEYSNWELSADRANAARRELVVGGMGQDRFAQVVGMGASAPFDEENLTNPANRRIVILVMNQETEDRLYESMRSSEQSGVPGSDISPPEPPEIF